MLIAFLGWTLIELALEVIYYFNEQIEALLIFNNLYHSTEEITHMTVFAKVNGYLLSALALFNATNFRNFYFKMTEVYYVCGLLCLTGMGMMYNLKRFKFKPAPMDEKTKYFTEVVVLSTADVGHRERNGPLKKDNFTEVVASAFKAMSFFNLKMWLKNIKDKISRVFSY